MSLARGCLWLAWCLVLVSAASGAPPAKAKPRQDRYGDPLPSGAVARLGTMRFQQNSIGAIALSFDGGLVAMVDQSMEGRGVFVADTGTGKRLWACRHKEMIVSPPVFSADGTLLAAGREGGDVLLWNTRTGQQVRQFRIKDTYAILMWIARDSKTLAAASNAGNVYWWEIATGKELRHWDFFSGKKLRRDATRSVYFLPMSFLPDGQGLVCNISRWRTDGNGKSELEEAISAFWDTRRRKEIWRQKTASRSINAFPSSVRAKYFASTGTGINLSLCSLQTGRAVRKLKWEEDPLSAAFSADGNLLASGHVPGDICLWESSTGKLLRTIPVRGEGSRIINDDFETMTLSGNGRVLAMARGNWLCLWDTATGKEMPAFDGHREPVRGISFTCGGRPLSISQARVCFWDRPTWKQTGRLDRWEGNDRFIVLAVSAEQGLFLTQEKDGTAGLRELTTGKILRSSRLERKECGRGAFAPDGRVLALLCGRYDQPEIVLHKVPSGKVLGRIVKPAYPSFLEFSADGKTLVWGDHGGVVWLTDAMTGKQVRSVGQKLTGKDAWAVKHRVAVSSDGKRLAIVPRMTREAVEKAGVDGRLRLWDAVSGREILSFVDVPDHVECLALSPDGRMLAAGSLDSPLVHVWETATGRKRFQLAGHRECVRCLAFSPDGKLLLSGSDDGTILVWDIRRPSAFAAPQRPR